MEYPQARVEWTPPSVSYPALPSPSPYPVPTTSSFYPQPPVPPPPVPGLGGASVGSYPSLPAPSSSSSWQPASYNPNQAPSLYPSLGMPPPPASSAPADDLAFDADVIPYDGGDTEPYGARGTGTGSYWSEGGSGRGGGYGLSSSSGRQQLVNVQVPSVSSAAPSSSISGGSKGSSSSRLQHQHSQGQSQQQDGVQSFRVKLLAEEGSSSSSPKDVLCKIGLDGVRLQEADGGRLMRVYPLDNITCWEVKEPAVFTFWVKTAVDVEQRAVRLRSDPATTTLILDTVTAACIQVFEMVGKDKEKAGGGAGSSASTGEGAGKSSSAGAATTSASGSSASSTTSLVEWMTRPRASTQQEEKTHWVPDEEAAKCSNCAGEFGTFVRRHHCRNCGNVFCDKCTRGRTPLTSDADAQPVRVCDACLAEVTQRLSYEKERAKDGDSGSKATDSKKGTGGSSAASAALPSHDELMKRLQSELERTNVSGSSVSKPNRSSSDNSSNRKPPPSMAPPALTGQPPPLSSSSVGFSGGRGSGAGSSGGSGRSSSANSAAAAASSSWLGTCNSCGTVALISGASPYCPGCGASSQPPSQQPSVSSAPAVPSGPASYASVPQGPPHLWPSSPYAADPAVAAAAAAPSPGSRQVVACPTCTVHLEVHVPSVGTETVECGVCQHPFLVGAGA